MNRLGMLIACSLLVACSERWDGYAYPDRSDLSRHRYVGEFTSLEECRGATQDVLRRVEVRPRGGDYECGLNCRGNGYPRICDRTER